MSNGSPLRHPRSNSSGFTLMEILIAVFITGMLALGVWQVMNVLIASRDGIDRVSSEFQQVQRAVMMFERDIFQSIDRSVRDGFGDHRAAMSSRETNADLVLTRQGWRNPLGERRSELQRVSWEYNDLERELIRRYWVVLDRAQDTEEREQVLLEDVESVEFRFRNREDSWIDNWPTNEPQAGNDQAILRAGLPRAVEVTLEHGRFGTIRRVVDLGTFQPEALGGTEAGPGQGDTQEGVQP